MKEKTPVVKERIDTEELLDFDLDGESSLDLDSFDEDDEVIELVDLVEEGEAKGPAVRKAEAAPKDQEINLDDLDLQLESLGEVGKPPVAEESQVEDELDLSDVTIEFGGDKDLRKKISEIPEAGEIMESELEGLLTEKEEALPIEGDKMRKAGDDAELEITEADLEGILEEEFEKESVKTSIQREEVSVSGEDLKQLEDALGPAPLRLAEVSVAAQAVGAKEAQPEIEKVSELMPKEEEPAVQEIAGLNEERLEMMISRVVENVVERVARETMTGVAERMIGEAIEALKRSLEASDPR